MPRAIKLNLLKFEMCVFIKKIKNSIDRAKHFITGQLALVVKTSPLVSLFFAAYLFDLKMLLKEPCSLQI